MSKPFASLLDLNSRFSLLFFFSFLPSISSSLLIYGLIIESFADPSFLIFREGYSSFLLLFTDSFTSSLYLLCSSSSISSRRNSSFHVPLFSLSLYLFFLTELSKKLKRNSRLLYLFISPPLLFLFHLIYPPSSSIRKEIQFSFCIAFAVFLSPSLIHHFLFFPFVYNFFSPLSSPNHFHLLLFTLIRKGIPSLLLLHLLLLPLLLLLHLSYFLFSFLPTKYLEYPKWRNVELIRTVRGCLIRRH